MISMLLTQTEKVMIYAAALQGCTSNVEYNYNISPLPVNEIMSSAEQIINLIEAGHMPAEKEVD